MVDMGAVDERASPLNKPGSRPTRRPVHAGIRSGRSSPKCRPTSSELTPKGGLNVRQLAEATTSAAVIGVSNEMPAHWRSRAHMTRPKHSDPFRPEHDFFSTRRKIGRSDLHPAVDRSTGPRDNRLRPVDRC